MAGIVWWRSSKTHFKVSNVLFGRGRVAASAFLGWLIYYDDRFIRVAVYAASRCFCFLEWMPWRNFLVCFFLLSVFLILLLSAAVESPQRSFSRAPSHGCWKPLPRRILIITSRVADTDQYLTVLDAATGDIISSTGFSEILGSYYNVGGLAIVPEDAFKEWKYKFCSV
jgi:hypothetical protein